MSVDSRNVVLIGNFGAVNLGDEVLLSTVAVLVVYLIGSLAGLKLRPAPLAASVMVVGIGFALFAFYGSGLEANLWGLALLAGGLTIRALMRRFNSSAATPPAGAPAAPPGSSS